jgi:hypothetical protein
MLRRIAKKGYDDKRARKEGEFGRESIMLTLVKTIFEYAIEKMELAVINILLL